MVPLWIYEYYETTDFQLRLGRNIIGTTSYILVLNEIHIVW